MTETTQTQPALTRSTATPTLNEQQEQQKILVQRLKEAGLNTKCFLKVGGSFDEKTGEFKPKAAFEIGWQNKPYNPEDFTKPCNSAECKVCSSGKPHMRWGINAGQDLILLDSDDLSLIHI